MSWEIILSIVTLLVSIFTILFFSIFPSWKKWKINKTFVKIEYFYQIYSYLNPCLYHANDINKITQQLIKQSWLAYGFPKFKFVIWKNIENFDPFELQNSSWKDNLSFKEIIYFYRFWKLAIKKLKYISHVLNQYQYIIELGSNLIVYNDKYTIINISSISLCPNFDNIKLHQDNFERITTTNKKLNLPNINKFEKHQNMIKELKTENFSLNIRFESKDINKIYSYSLIFKKNKPVKLEPFFTRKIINLDENDINQIKIHINWFNNIFKINSLKLIGKLPYYTKDLQFD